jgi:High potential iron-sulfur protein
MDPASKDRRRWLQCVLLAIGSGPGMAASGMAASTLLNESDPEAMAYGYRANAKQVDRSKYPSYDGRQTCVNCKLIAFGTGIQRPCSVFPGRLVSAGGWCKAWVRKGT